MAEDQVAAFAAEADAEAAAAADLVACKRFRRVDGNEDDELIGRLMGAARSYLSGAGIEAPESGDRSQYDLAVHSLTLHYYDHRDAVGDEKAFPIGLRPVINQLNHLGDGCL